MTLDPTRGYDTDFYDTINSGSTASAEVVVPIVLKELNLDPTNLTVVDVGCGEGAWAAAFARRGAKVTGLDGDYVEKERLLIDGEDFIPTDLALPIPGWHDGDAADLAVSLEVAEHLPPERAASFIADLCALAPIVLFSAAIPGQGGHHHINEQWPQYWAELFQKQGYTVTGALRWQIWNDPRVENWYRQNLLVAAKDPSKIELFQHPLTDPIPVVHPVLWNHHKGLT